MDCAAAEMQRGKRGGLGGGAGGGGESERRARCDPRLITPFAGSPMHKSGKYIFVSRGGLSDTPIFLQVCVPPTAPAPAFAAGAIWDAAFARPRLLPTG